MTFRNACCLIVCVCSFALIGCETTQRAQTGGSPALDRDRQPDRRARTEPSAAHLKEDFVRGLSGRPSVSSHIRAAISPRGSVAYDDMTLPLASPDGRFLAVQSGVSPTWSTLLAEHEADPPVATTIDIYQVRTAERDLAHIASVSHPALVGRSADHDGFLVEAPQYDGSRWIGKVHWTTGEIEWLVADEYVNAFPSLGAGGRLAWSRRAIDDHDESFELVVRYGMDEWSIPADERSWLMPTWSNRREHALYVLMLDIEHDLEMIYADTSSPAAFRQSMRSLLLARNADVFTAYQTIGAQTIGPAGYAPPQEEFVFYHPSRMRMAIWRPLSTRGANPLFLMPRSFAAVVEPDGFALVSTEDDLVLQALEHPDRQRRQMLSGMQVLRQVQSEEWPYLLLVPQEGRIGVAAMTLIPPEE